jgi:hypothetical protein
MNDVVTALAAAVPLASGWAWHGVVLRRLDRRVRDRWPPGALAVTGAAAGG